jgi:hypothetical protein
MFGVFIAMSAELFELYSPRIVTAIFGGCVARNTGRSLVYISATLSAFEGNDNANAFSHCFSLNL